MIKMSRCFFCFGVISALLSSYINCDDQIHHYTNQFVVWCDDEGNDDIIAEWSLSEKFTIEKLNIPGQDCLYLVTDMSKPKGTRSIEQDTKTVKTLMAPKKVKKVEQQEYKMRVKKTADTQWSNLWYLNGDVAPSMKIQEAWNLGYNGSGVTIAVVDDGVEITHTDLDANMYSGYHYDYVDNDTNPDPADGSKHGTECSGLIVAEANNNECVVGVAYRAKVIGVRLLSSTGTTDLMESQSLGHQRSIVDIYSNSWGPTDGYGYSDTGTLVKAALLSGITTGRSGKGAIFTWAAGNGYKDDNCNADGFVNSIYTIGVTSLDSTGIPAFYSEVCASAMATTYGGTYTSRYLYSTANSGSCASDLQGTSFSTPVASGIIALALQANPNLNWRDVQHLLVLTSKKYSLSDSYYSWQLNGAKKYVHSRLGFGLMDAEDMVRYASTWTQVPSQVSFQSSTSSVNSYVGAAGVSNSITIGSTCSIQYLEHVQVQLALQADGLGYVEITLTSPFGTKSYLMTRRYLDNDNTGSGTWTFMTVHHWGEAPQGQWTIKMSVSALTGILSTWKLILYGTQTNPLPSTNVSYTRTSTTVSTIASTRTSTTVSTIASTRTSTKVFTNSSTMISTTVSTNPSTRTPTTVSTIASTRKSPTVSTNSSTKTSTTVSTNPSTMTPTTVSTIASTRTSPTVSTNSSTMTSTTVSTIASTRTSTNFFTNSSTRTSTAVSTNPSTRTPTTVSTIASTGTSPTVSTNSYTMTSTTVSTIASTSRSTKVFTNSSTRTSTTVSTNPSTRTPTTVSTIASTMTSPTVSTNSSTRTSTTVSTIASTSRSTKVFTNSSTRISTTVSTHPSTMTPTTVSTIASTRRSTKVFTNSSTRTPTTVSTNSSATTSTTAANDSSTIAAIAGGVAAGAVLVGIVVAIVVKMRLRSAAQYAPAAA